MEALADRTILWDLLYRFPTFRPAKMYQFRSELFAVTADQVASIGQRRQLCSMLFPIS